MIRLLADVNFDFRIVQGLRRRIRALDVVIAQDVGLDETEDPELLKWAADENRIVLSHDVNTMVGFAYERVGQSLRMPGLFVVEEQLALGRAIEDLKILILASAENEFDGQVVFIPY